MCKFVLTAWWFGMFCGGALVIPAAAQDAPVRPRVVDQPGVPQPKPPGDAEASRRPRYEEPPETRPVPPPRPLTREEQQRVQTSAQSAAELVARSRRSFERGLLPLPDYLEQLSLADQVDLSVADLRQSDDARKAVLRQQLIRYREAARNLEGFVRQAGPIGFGDQAFAEALVAQAEAKLAFAENRTGTAWQALKEQSEWATRYAQVRRLDESLGLVPPETLIEAELLDGVASVPPGPEQVEIVGRSLKQYRSDLEALQERIRRWAAADAGIGRSDREQRTRFELARVDMELAALQNDPRAHEAAFIKGIEASEALHTELMKYYSTGTATLFDIAAAWRQRDQLFQEFAGTTDAPEQRRLREAVATNLKQDFVDVMQIAGRTRDLRGRHAGDVQYVQTLESLNELRSIAAAITDNPESQPDDGSETIKKPNVSTNPAPGRPALPENPPATER